jgi:hypothetical protein
LVRAMKLREKGVAKGGTAKALKSSLLMLSTSPGKTGPLIPQ